MTITSLAEQIANHLRREILRGKLPPGAPVKERDNATDLGVSRTPMREAIRILAKEGLVDLRPSRSPLVARPSLREVKDAIDVLTALEVLSGQLACRNATLKEIEGLRQIHTQMSDIYDTADPLDLFEVDMSFHLAIAQASHNALLAETHQAYLARLWRVRYLTASLQHNRERVLDQHATILNGLETRAVAQVTAGIGLQLDGLVESIAQVLKHEDESGSVS
ncbi:MAG: GntR family transcriptional regulator [Pseudomonadota bacterium]